MSTAPERPAKTAQVVVLACLLAGILILPLLAVVAWESVAPDGTYPQPAIDRHDLVSRTFSVEYVPAVGVTEFDRAQGKAPPFSEVAVYLNDDIVDITRANALGQFEATLPPLPDRTSILTALPAEVDRSTLALFYTSSSFRPVPVEPQRSDPPTPPLVSLPIHVNADANEVTVYGSTVPLTQVELALDGSVVGAGESDREGSFSISVPLDVAALEEPHELSARSQLPASSGWSDFSDPVMLILGESTSRPEAVFVRTVHVDLTTEAVRVLFDVEMPTGYKVYQNLIRGDISEQTFLTYVFGSVTMSTFLDPRELAWRQNLEPASGRVLVTIDSGLLPYLVADDPVTFFRLREPDERQHVPPYTMHDMIILTLGEGLQLSRTNLQPLSSEMGHVSWDGPLVGNPEFRLEVLRDTDLRRDSYRMARVREDFEALYDDLSNVATEPVLQPSLEGNLIGLLPRRPPAVARAQVYDFYSSLYLEEPLITVDDQTNTLRTYIRDLPSRVPSKVEDVLLAMMWLLPGGLMVWALRSSAPSDGQPAVWDLALVGWGTLLTVGLTIDLSGVFPELTRIPRETYLAFAIAANMMFVVLLWPAPSFRSVWWLRGRSVTPLLVLLTVVVLPLVLGSMLRVGLPFLPDPITTGLLAFFFLASLLVLTFRAAKVGVGADPDKANADTAESVGHSPGRRRWVGVLFLLLAMLVLSMPIQNLSLFAQLRGSVGVSTFSVNAMRPILSYALVAGALAYWRASGARTEITLLRLDKAIGMAFFLAFAVGLRPAWGYIPLSLVFGWLLFEFWLIDDRAFADNPDILRDILQDNAKRAQFIRDRLWFKAQERRRRERDQGEGRGLVSRLFGKRSTRSEAPDETAAEENSAPDVSYITPAILRSGIEPTELAFSFGPTDDRWHDVVHTLRRGRLYLIPMLLIYSVAVLTAGLEETLPFPLLGGLVRLGALGVQLMASSVFLAYYFPFIRGRTGLSKSLALTGAIIAAFLPVHALNVDTAADVAGIVVWAVNLLVFNLYIGLVIFDLRNLQVHGIDWRRLGDLHNLPLVVLTMLPQAVAILLPVVSTFVQDQFGGATIDLLSTLLPPLTPGSPESALVEMLTLLAEQIVGGL